MIGIRVYLALVTVSLAFYTVLVGIGDGWNLLPVFFGDIARLSWPGQFNLDFMSFLGLSGIWVAWRHRFGGAGVALGVAAFFGGMMFLAPYLLWALARVRGDVNALLLGEERAVPVDRR